MLENKLIKLRSLEPTDVELLYAWENNTKIWFISNTIVPFSKYILRQYIENAHLDIYEAKQLRLMIDSKPNEYHPEGATVGSIDLFDYDPYHNRAGIGILIHHQSDRQRGYATEALKVLIKYSFEVLCLHQLYCNISAGNDASMKLFSNRGFRVVGEKKDWRKTKDGWTGEYLLQLIN